MSAEKQNPYELAAREKKASAIIDFMVSKGWADPELVEHMEPRHWQMAAREAGLKNPPSAETIAVIKARLKARAATA